MPAEYPRSARAFHAHLLYSMLMPVPIACFVGTLITDLVYWKTTTMQWANMSVWLLAVGLVVSVVVVIAGLIDFFSDKGVRALPGIWIYGLANAVALILSIFNVFIHSRDAYTSVVPTGLVLSAVVVLILLVTSVTGWTFARRRAAYVAWEARL